MNKLEKKKKREKNNYDFCWDDTSKTRKMNDKC